MSWGGEVAGARPRGWGGGAVSGELASGVREERRARGPGQAPGQTVMLIWAIPAIAWAVHGTVFSVTDFLRTVSKPLLSSIVAAACGIGVRALCGPSLPVLPRLACETATLVLVYGVLTWFVTGQKQLYVELFRAVGSKSPSMEKEVLMSTGA